MDAIDRATHCFLAQSRTEFTFKFSCMGFAGEDAVSKDLALYNAGFLLGVFGATRIRV